MQGPIVVDLETEAIEPRPKYPPKPVGLAVKWGDAPAEYWAFAHPTENNSTFDQALRVLKDAWRSGKPLLFHNAKFDLEVIETHFGLPPPPWDQVHDTLYLLFLTTPHAPDLKLKPSSERILGMAPEERDAVRDWLVEHGIIAKSAGDDTVGANICRAPGNVVGEYAKGDVIRTELLFQKLYPSLTHSMRVAYDRERRLMPILLRNEREGIRVDTRRLEKDLKTYEKAFLQADRWLRTRLSSPDLNLDADADVAAALKASGVVAEFVKTPKSGKDSVSKKNLTPSMFTDPEVARVWGYRNRLQTVLSNSMRPWLEQSAACRGMISTSWNQVRGEGGGTRTGRLSCSRLQNITKDFNDKNDGYEHPKTVVLPELPLVRRYLLPDEGCVWLHRDYSQQEFRIIAHYAEGELLDAYLRDPRTDFHNLMQDNLRKVGLDVARRLVKIINFSIKYGTGPRALALLLWGKQTPEAIHDARTIIDGVRRASPSVEELNKTLKKRARRGEPIRTWGGRLYFCEAPREVWIDKNDHAKGKRLQHFDYKLLSYLIQGSAADCTKEALLRYHDVMKYGRFLVTVHDEVNVSVPKKAIKVEDEILRQAMESIEFDVPMLSDPKYGPSWGELKA